MCVEIPVFPAAEEIMEKTEVEVSWGNYALIESPFLKREKLALRKFGAQQARQALREPPAAHTYMMKDGRGRVLFFHVFRERSFSVTLLNGARFSPLPLDNSQCKTKIPYEMSVQTELEAQFYFHPLIFISRRVE